MKSFKLSLVLFITVFALQIGTADAMFGDVFARLAAFGRAQTTAIKSLFNTQSRAFTNVVWPKQPNNTVRVYHLIGGFNDNSLAPSLENVKKYGLLSSNELFKRGYIKNNPSKESWILPGHYDLTYFRYLPKTHYYRRFKSFDPYLYFDNVVGFDVDPHSTHVYNSEFRIGGTLHQYNKSKTLLAHYIDNLKKYHEMNKSVLPGKIIVFDPYTSEPFQMDKEAYERLAYITDGSQLPSRYHIYLNEITISGGCIEPKRLVFPKEL